jgi:colanic acid biosynthesis protein WcaH
MLNSENFKEVVRNTNLFAFDLIVKNPQGEVLIAKRRNSPAKGYWFVPGGRVYKNESLDSAFDRILTGETGLSKANFLSVKGKDLYNHIYKENFCEDASFNTHYIVYVVECILGDDTNIMLDSQHSEYKFVDTRYIVKNDNIHKYTKKYFIDNVDNVDNMLNLEKF